MGRGECWRHVSEHAHMHMHTCTHAHAHMHMHMHMQMRMRMRMRMHKEHVCGCRMVPPRVESPLLAPRMGKRAFEARGKLAVSGAVASTGEKLGTKAESFASSASSGERGSSKALANGRSGGGDSLCLMYCG